MRDVRVRGAIGVVELDRTPDHQAMTARFAARRVCIRPFNKIVYRTPAFIAADDDLARLIGAVVADLSERH